ncbi:fluoride efflux transporter CrcB [Falsibacillus pallidus]|uniref:Fluoride-specific ion channel FluC n=1 Tax=Falsibacillus pallidus TaxID=493781 RepID=A0A370GPK5_9BACI|nr:fluoride efflux transporter CrcB [Falsibacillus pallidus]RDI45617.1 CrcB protein [Falsibacillus pallidus]
MIINGLYVAIGAFFGAMARFGLSSFSKKKYPSDFPLGTLLVNLIGSFLLGIINGKEPDAMWALLLGTGFMGSFTTFSTFKVENIELHFKRKWKIVTMFLAISYTFGILLAFAGMQIGYQMK